MRGLQSPVRNGFSLLEVQIAFVLLGIALAGLCPLLVIQSKQVKQIENQLNDRTTYYLIPLTNQWARKLGASASVQTTDPGPSASGPVLLLTNGDAAYAEFGLGWITVSNPSVLGGAYRVHLPVGGQSSAVWTFSGLEPGPYTVEATWPALPWAVSNAGFQVATGGTTLLTATVDQTIQPADENFDGVWWARLGTVDLSSDTVQVTLSGQAGGLVLANGVRLSPRRNTVQVLSLNRSLTSQDQTAHVSVTPYGN